MREYGETLLVKDKIIPNCHIAITMAQTPTLMFVFSDLTTLLSQFSNIYAILRGGVILKDM
jgi:spore coat protein CotF